MQPMDRAEVAVIGGGIVGLASAVALLQARPGMHVVVLEKEDAAAAHQSGRNSGVIHSGVYYRPGSVKARTVAAGRKALLEFCRRHGIAHQVTGKVIVAVDESERPGLRELEHRASCAGVTAELLGPEGLAELEPHAAGVAALHVPSAGVVDFSRVCAVLVELLEQGGGEFRPRSQVVDVGPRNGSVILRTERQEVEVTVAVNCAGLHADVLAAMGAPGQARGLRIVPFRGEYRRLAESRAHLVRTMIYPVPDPRFPFLGVHLTRGIGGDVHAGPNAVLALAREGYSWRDVDIADTLDLVRFPGFRRLARRHWRTGIGEVRRSLSQRAFVQALQRLVPEIQGRDLIAAPAGVRAQAVDGGGALVDDFVVEESANLVHVLNAPSPAATASLEIGRLVAARVLERV